MGGIPIHKNAHARRISFSRCEQDCISTELLMSNVLPLHGSRALSSMIPLELEKKWFVLHSAMLYGMLPCPRKTARPDSPSGFPSSRKPFADLSPA